MDSPLTNEDKMVAKDGFLEANEAAANHADDIPHWSYSLLGRAGSHLLILGSTVMLETSHVILKSMAVNPQGSHPSSK
jgi:hypothetical protein